MEYEGQICRAPMERSSFMLPVTVGCPYNKCKFCGLFRHLKYRKLSMEQIEAELLRVKNMGGSPKNIFLGDGNAFGLDTAHLTAILKKIREYFPLCEGVNMDATVSSILNKSRDDLILLGSHGVKNLYIGIESGLDDVLEFMKKGNDLSQAREAIRRIKEAGMDYSAHIMTGVSGKGRGMENAAALAEFLNETGPKNVVNFSMFIHEEVPLYAHIKDGTFKPADELENLKEERKLIELLGTEEMPITYEGFHDYIEFRIRGRLPKDRDKMLAKLDSAIDLQSQKPKIYSYVTGICPELEKKEYGDPVWRRQSK